MKGTSIYFVLFISLIFSRGRTDSESELYKNNEEAHKNEDREILQKLSKLELDIKSFAKSAVRYSLRYFMKLAEETNLSTSCIKGGIVFLKDFLQLKEWTLRMLDSFGKPPPGILTGSFWIRGDYDQCLNLKKNNNEISTNRLNEIIYGKYCVIKIKIPPLKKESIETIFAQDNNTLIKLIKKIFEPFHPKMMLKSSKIFETYSYFDICIPSTCKKDDVENVANHLFGNMITKVDYCQTRETKIKYSTAQVICIVSIGFFVIWVIFASILDMMLKLNIVDLCCNEKAELLLKTFNSVSAFKSGKKLFSATFFQRTSSLCGIKTIIISFIVLGHTAVYPLIMSEKIEKIFNIKEMFNNILVEICVSTIIMIDTFFFISGYLTLYFSRRNERNSKLQYILFLLKRVISLTLPVLCILAIVIILPLFTDGPGSKFISEEFKGVEKEWWKYSFHLSNILEYKNKSINYLWFMNVLVQLTVLSFPFIIIYDRFPIFGRVCFIILSFFGFISFAILMFIRKYSVIFGYSFDAEKMKEYMVEINFKPYYSHLSSFSFGLLVGSILSNKKELKFRKNIKAFIWLVVVTLMILVIFGVHGYRKTAFPNEQVIISHKILSPYAWTIAIAWICIDNATGRRGVLHRFLSLRIFIVIDRLNIWIYLIHPLIIFFILNQLRNSMALSELNWYMLGVFIMFLSVIASFFIYIFLHYPLFFLMNKLFVSNKRNEKSSEEQQPKDDNNLEELRISK